jgi:hypothetical protein
VNTHVSPLGPAGGHAALHLGAARALVAARRFDEAIVACKHGVALSDFWKPQQ